MWIVDAPSPSNSVPPSPGLSSPHVMPPFSMQNTSSHSSAAPRQGTSGSIGGGEMTPGPPFTSTGPGVSISASQLPGVNMSGRLSGVVSLTDVLNVFARASGLQPGDPDETRMRRRRSSSRSSTRGGNVDSVRASAEFMRGGELGRSGSNAGKR